MSISINTTVNTHCIETLGSNSTPDMKKRTTFTVIVHHKQERETHCIWTGRPKRVRKNVIDRNTKQE